jgi:pyruvate carboxylase subunit B
MPGGAIGPNVHMMVKAGIAERYGEVLAEFPVVVEAGGAWTSVTPGSQQYWLQAFNNVLYGRWAKIEAGYGKAVLGYFGRTPLAPDPMVVQKASDQLGLPPFEGDPLDAAPRSIGAARQALEDRDLPVTDENIFLVLSAMVPGKKLEVNEGLRLLSGEARIDVPLKKKAEPAPPPAPVAPAPAAAPAPRGPQVTRCTVEEDGQRRTFTVILEPMDGDGTAGGSTPMPVATAAPRVAREAPAEAPGTPVYSTFAGAVEVVDILVRVGDRISEGDVIAAVEAMKARHDIRSPVGGTVRAVHAAIGKEIDRSTPIMTIG